MQNKETKNINQVKLFDLIEKTLPKSESLAYAVSEFLGIGSTATYNRINGNKPISFEEAIKLCEHFNIPLDSVVNVAYKNLIQCYYTPLNLDKISDFFDFAQNILNIIEKAKKTPNSEIILSAIDIPQFNLLAYNELTLFKLYSWNKGVYGTKNNFEKFAEEITNSEILSYFKKISETYQFIPSTDIWSDNTIDTFLKLLDYHIDMKHFSDKKTPLLLCGQLINLIDTLHKWTENGIKGTENTPFKFHVSNTELESTVVLFKMPEITNCMIKLYTLNGIGISDERFCSETENWLRTTAQRSTLISGASEKERHRFFSAQKAKIENLIKKI